MLRQPKLAAYITSIRAYPEGLAFSARVEQALDDVALRSTEPRVMVEFPDGRSCGNDDPNRLHRDDLSWLHFATLSEGAQLVRPSVDGGRPAPICRLCVRRSRASPGLQRAREFQIRARRRLSEETYGRARSGAPGRAVPAETAWPRGSGPC